MRMSEWGRRRGAARLTLSLAAFVMVLGTLTDSGAHLTSANSFQDNFEYANGTPLTQGPSGSSWQVSPYVPGGFLIQARPASANTAALGTVNVLASIMRQGVPNEPIAFVKKSVGNFVMEAQAAWDRVVTGNSGVGLVFHAGVDAVSGLADRNNLYLFSAINVAPNPRFYPTGHAFQLFKRVAGQYYMMAPPVNSLIDFTSSQFHTYKVEMSGTRILAWVDGMQVFNIVDSPGDDAMPGGYSSPGPARVSGAVGLRNSAAQALFDNITVLGAPGYEGRAAAANLYGKLGADGGLGNGSLGTIPLGRDVGATAGDTGFQYHDHDFTQDFQGLNANQNGGPVATAIFHTEGVTNMATSAAQIAGLVGTWTDQSGRTTVNLSADLIRATANASCNGATSTVDVVNLTWEVVSRDGAGNVVTRQGNTTKFSAPPNYNLLDPASGPVGPLPTVATLNPNATLSTAPVKMVLHSRQVTGDPQRVEASALRITFLAPVDVHDTNASTKNVPPAVVTADLAIGDVVAGKLCE